MRKILLFIYLVGIVLNLTNCKSPDKNENEEKNKSSDSVQVQAVTDKEKEFKFLNIIANIPSPTYEIIEIAKAGEKINIALCNPVSNLENYNTSYKQAINYGVYLSDLAYVAAFNQKQSVLDYFSATRSLAEKTEY